MPLPSKLVLMAMAILSVASLTESQQTVQSCAAKLVPCYKFINSKDKPDNTCCSSIKDAIANELQCLCTIYTTPGLLAQFNVSVPNALRVTKDCNLPDNISSCKVGAPSPTPGSVLPPPGTPGNGATGMLAWTGITSLLLFWGVSFMLY